MEGLDKSALQAYHCLAAARLGVSCGGGQEERGCSISWKSLQVWVNVCVCFIPPSHGSFWSVAELWLSWTRWLKFSPSHTIPTSCTSLKPATTLKVGCTCGLGNGSKFIVFLTCHLSSAASVSSLEVIKHLLHCSRVLWRCFCVCRMVIRIYKYLAQKSCFLCSCYRCDFWRAFFCKEPVFLVEG